MSDWLFLNGARVKAATPRVSEMYVTSNADGFNGMFRFAIEGRWIR